MTPTERLKRIDKELAAQTIGPTPETRTAFELPELGAAPGKKYKLLADGDSWFDYPLGQDVLDYLNNYFKHPVTKLARAGSTLNELVYGPGDILASDPSQGTTRLTEVVRKLREVEHQPKKQFHAFLFPAAAMTLPAQNFSPS